MSMAMPSTMRAWWMKLGPAGAELQLRQVDMPQPGPGQLLVRLHAAGLNRGEFLYGHGLHAAGSWKAIGGEGAGEVLTVGQGVSGIAPGARVMGRCAGAFAEYALMEAAEAMAVPERLSWVQAAAVPLTFLVAHDMLVLQGGLQAGQWVLINGVSSGVGVACLQLAKAMGAEVIGTSGSQAKLDALAPLGLVHGIASRQADFSGRVMDITANHGADLIVNTVGGTVLAENLRAAAFEARLAIVGYVDGVLRAELDLELLHAKRLHMVGVSNKLRTKAQRAAALPAFVHDVLPPLTDGRITPQIDSVFDFGQLPEAKAKMEAGGHVGKIVLQMP